EVFIPLEMDQSYANIKEGVEGGLADGYRNLFGLEFPGKTKVVESMIPSSYLMSGAEDMSHYLMTILNEGKYRDHRILSKDNAERLIKPLSNNSPYGVGWYYSGSYSWHTGEEPDYNGYMKVIPSGKLGIVMLCNTNDIVGKALAKDSSSTRRIPEGIMDMLSGFELPEAPALNMKMVYVIIDAFFLLMLLTVSFSLRRAWRQRKLPPKSRAYFIRNIFEVLLIHAALPVTLIVGIPYYFQATPPFFAINIPDFYAALVSISLILVTSGFIKLRRLFRRSSF
ncbi:MAG: serine hydrolase, partial [Bacillota bacterium]|nr:serine hydrolase [Bacillota bacterium]